MEFDIFILHDLITLCTSNVIPSYGIKLGADPTFQTGFASFARVFAGRGDLPGREASVGACFFATDATLGDTLAFDSGHVCVRSTAYCVC